MNRARIRVPAPVAVLILLGGLALSPAGGQEAPIRIAVVDIDRVVAQSASGQALQGRLARFQEEAQAEGEAKAAAARNLQQRIANGANSLSQAELGRLQKEYEAAVMDIRRFQEDKQREGQRIQAEGLREIERRLQPVFESVRDEGGFDLILNRASGVVVMANARVDITAQVIAKFNAAASPGN